MQLGAQRMLGLITWMENGQIFVKDQPNFFLKMYRGATAVMILMNLAEFDRLTDVGLTPQLLRVAESQFALLATAETELGYPLTLVSSHPSTLRFTRVSVGLDAIDHCENSNMEFELYLRGRHLGKSRSLPLHF